jgi:hypothetical protein
MDPGVMQAGEASTDARREATRRCREKQQAELTFHELHGRIGGDRATLVTILNNEIRRGRMTSSRLRYA